MKSLKIAIIGLISLAFAGSLNSCTKDFLEREPEDQVIPENYFKNESELAAYTINLYGNVLYPNGRGGVGSYYTDVDTDDLADDYSNIYVPGQWQVPATGGSWEFNAIRNCNYFLERVPELYAKGEISGNPSVIQHYIGEGYMLRAINYFDKVKKMGDYPIITQLLPVDQDSLVLATQRRPHSEVVRFIIEDLDKAFEMMMEMSPDGKKNRLSKNCALLFKSRVALYEATWLKYFKGTAFVPNGPNWPGAEKDYNNGYSYQAGSIDSEIDWLLGQAMDAASQVADKFSLTPNNGILQQSASDPINPYFNMFSNQDMSDFPEILFWREFNPSLGIGNNNSTAIHWGNSMIGTTRGLVETFLMEDGLPIYASPLYQGDDHIRDVRENRDNRLFLFLQEPGQINLWVNTDLRVLGYEIEPEPIITRSDQGGYRTGYTLRKGSDFDGINTRQGEGNTGEIVYRASEAYLNYMEACYERNGNLDGKATMYWKALRNRALVDNNFSNTIAATQMTEEALNDWGAYSAGNMIDPTLFNIRRERRSELIAEGFRDMDLRRWRAKDQMIGTPYHIEGFKLYNSAMTPWYQKPDGSWNDDFIIGGGVATVSSPDRSDYLRPYEKNGRELVYDGYRWAMAHYWEPIATSNFRLSSVGGDDSTSPIYQNPGWTTNAGDGAQF
jgi:hypothetical protein